MAVICEEYYSDVSINTSHIMEAETMSGPSQVRTEHKPGYTIAVQDLLPAKLRL